MKQLNILQISKKIPYPQRDGESVASHALAKGLASLSGVRIDLLTLHTNKHQTDETVARKKLSSYREIEFINHDLSIDPMALVRDSFTGKTYNINRFHSSELAQRLERYLTHTEYDIVLLETIYTTSYIEIIRQVSPNSGIVLRLHNIEFHIWQQRSIQSKNLAKKLIFKSLSKQIEQYTVGIVSSVDKVLTISTMDHQWVLNSGLLDPKHVHYQPVGIENVKTKVDHSRVEPGKLHVGFIGAMDWEPNIKGLDWFITQVWQPFFIHQPNIHLHLAGRKYPKGRYAKIQGVTEHAEVPNARRFLDRLDVLIAPLFIGSGVRIKILEAMAAGTVVISTSVGISGIELKDGEEAFIANKADEFAHLINTLHQNEDKLSLIKKKANEFIIDNYNQEKLSKQLYKLLIEVKTRNSS